MKLNELLKKMIEQRGVSVSDDTIKKILDNNALASLEVDDVVSTKLTEPIFTLESAKQNPEIINSIRAAALDGVDAEIKSIIEKQNWTPEQKQEVLSQNKTKLKLEKLTEKLAELNSQKGSSDTQTTLNKKIEELNGQIKIVRDEYEVKLKSVGDERKSDKIGWELNSIYNGFNYALPDVPKDVATIAAKSVIDKLVKEKGLTFDLTDEGLKIKTKEGTDYFDNNVKVSPSEFIQKNLLQSKLLKVSDKSQNGNGQQQRPATGSNGSSNGTPLKGMEALDSLLEDSIKNNGQNF